MTRSTHIGKLGIATAALFVILAWGGSAQAVDLNKKCADIGGNCAEFCKNSESVSHYKYGCAAQRSCCVPKGQTCADNQGVCSGGCGGDTVNATSKFDCLEDCCVPKSSAIGSKIGDVQSSSSTQVTDASTDVSAGGAQSQPPITPPGGLAQLTCEASGDCTIDMIVEKGVAFAQFIMGLSGAMFLLVFVYGGAMYVLSFGRSTWVDKGKKAMIQACIGIVLVMGAWTIVYYVSQSIGYKAPAIGSSSGAGKGGSKGVCGTAAGTEGRSCMDTAKEGKGKSCMAGYCPGTASMQCCK